MSAAADGVHGTDYHGSSILAPNDSQNWNVDFNLRRSTLAILDQPTQPPPPLPLTMEDEEENCDTYCSEERLQFSQSLEKNEEEGECAGAVLSQLTPRSKTKRVIYIIHHCDSTVVSAGKGMDESAAESSVADDGSPPS